MDPSSASSLKCLLVTMARFQPSSAPESQTKSQTVVPQRYERASVVAKKPLPQRLRSYRQSQTIR
jgi:hypothetical protein